MPQLDHDRYSAYLNQHLFASDAGMRAFQAAADSWGDNAYGQVFATIHEELKDSRARVVDLIEGWGYQVSTARTLLSGVAQLAGRLNPLNPSRDADSDTGQLEVDSLVGAVRTQRMMWETLDALRVVDDRVDAEFVRAMLARCDSQIQRICEVSAATAPARFTIAD